MDKFLTIFTPTHNRAYIIDNLYRSLKRQTSLDFEWLVIDDGSADNTKGLFDSRYSCTTDFPVRYYYQSNGGKCRAINRALDLAQGKMFLIVDSDDILADDAVEKIIQWERNLEDKEKYCGFAGNMGTSPDDTTNHLSGQPYVDGSLLDRYSCFDGERAVIFYTAIARKYNYPVFDGEKFMTEAVVYNRMAHDGYKTRFYDDIICIYEYQEDGLTRQGSRLFLENPRGYGLWLREKNLFLSKGLNYRMHAYYTFVCDLCDRYDLRTISECIGLPRVFCAFCYFIHRFRSFARKRSGGLS